MPGSPSDNERQSFLDNREDYVLAMDSLEAFEASGEKALGIKDIDWDSTNR